MEFSTITPKGLAVLAAIENGLLPKTESGVDTAQFEGFWHQYGYCLFSIKEPSKFSL